MGRRMISLLLCSVASIAEPLSSQEPAGWGENLEFSTFSIAAIDPPDKGVRGCRDLCRTPSDVPFAMVRLLCIAETTSALRPYCRLYLNRERLDPSSVLTRRSGPWTLRRLPRGDGWVGLSRKKGMPASTPATLPLASHESELKIRARGANVASQCSSRRARCSLAAGESR